MSETEQKVLDEDVQPVWWVLVKVSLVFHMMPAVLTLMGHLAPQDGICHQELDNHHPALLVCCA
jgi:hypothetical protein